MWIVSVTQKVITKCIHCWTSNNSNFRLETVQSWESFSLNPDTADGKQTCRDCGMAKSSERIKSQHLYHVTFFRNVISDAFQMHFGHFSELYLKCIPNASEMYQKSIPNSNKNTIFLQNKPTIRPETNQISSIHCKK